MEIENNKIENKIRQLALMYSFFATCKEHDVNPRDWLRDLLVRIGNYVVNLLEEVVAGGVGGNLGVNLCWSDAYA